MSPSAPTCRALPLERVEVEAGLVHDHEDHIPQQARQHEAHGLGQEAREREAPFRAFPHGPCGADTKHMRRGREKGVCDVWEEHGEGHMTSMRPRQARREHEV
jgi:hypothetical protein